MDRKQITITGGAGSLGRAFVRLLAPHNDVLVVDSNEWAIAELKGLFPSVQTLLRDFSDVKFNEHPTDVLIHCAAFKHVELGEEDPVAFIDNNLTKTAKLFEMANWYCSDIIFISTDKAVEPISTYGMTKALGERLALHYGGSVARLGNILSSNGSVIPLWEQAIKLKEPVKITDERMVRYFIEDSEAAQAVWSDFSMGKKIIVPEMKEIRVMDLLTEVLERHGYATSSDYLPGVEVIGMRPGEKLSEQLTWPHERD